MNRAIRLSWLGLALLTLLGISSEALAHAERAAFFPDHRATARPAYRPLLDASGNTTLQSPRLVVCKKAGQEGVTSGKDSAALIAAMPAGALKTANEKLLRECTYEHLQSAVDAVSKRGSNIYVLPGIYREQPSVRSLEQNFGARLVQDRDYCKAVVARGPGQLSYEEQFRCPHIQNTVAIFGDPDYTDDNCGSGRDGTCAGDPKTLACDPSKSACQYYDLQIEGTGAKVTDVIFEGDFITKPGDAADGKFRYLNGIRGDRTDGLYLRNFTTQIYEFNAVYVIEADGYVFDHLLSRWVDEYAFLTFASDHGLYDYTEGYSAADSVQYPGSGADIYPHANHAQANLRARQATEIRNSKGHHSALGYSGTAGNAPWVHDNEFYKNQTGMATESLYGGHPGMPQDHGLFENNKVYANNKDYYQYVADNGPCITKSPRDRGLVPPELRYFDELPADHQEAIMDRTIICPPIPFPTGSGMLIGGGNYNVVQKNQVYDNWRQGYWLISMPTLVHMINDPYAPKLLPADIIKMLPAPVGGVAATANDIVSALQAAASNGSLPLLLQQPIYASHYNRFLDNQFGKSASGATRPNGVDFWWDGSGKGNCWNGNQSNSGAPTVDTGKAMPSACEDGDQPDFIEQLTTAYPPRILPYVPCLTYSRSDPSSKQLCPFFTPLTPPAGRQDSAMVTAQQPSNGLRTVGGVTELGYFVLHNDTGNDHRLKSAELRVSGHAASFAGTRLSINGVRSATAVITGNSLRFEFAEPVTVARIAATLVELEEGTPASAGKTASTPAASGMGDNPLLASLGLGTTTGVLLLMGGLSRRQRWLLVALVTTMAVMSGCGGQDGDSSGNGSSRGTGSASAHAGNTDVQLVTLTFDTGSTGASYAGLPLLIGQVERP